MESITEEAMLGLKMPMVRIPIVFQYQEIHTN